MSDEYGPIPSPSAESEWQNSQSRLAPWRRRSWRDENECQQAHSTVVIRVDMVYNLLVAKTGTTLSSGSRSFDVSMLTEAARSFVLIRLEFQIEMLCSSSWWRSMRGSQRALDGCLKHQRRAESPQLSIGQQASLTACQQSTSVNIGKSVPKYPDLSRRFRFPGERESLKTR